LLYNIKGPKIKISIKAQNDPKNEIKSPKIIPDKSLSCELLIYCYCIIKNEEAIKMK
jgi:hypothetical protein